MTPDRALPQRCGARPGAWGSRGMVLGTKGADRRRPSRWEVRSIAHQARRPRSVPCGHRRRNSAQGAIPRHRTWTCASASAGSWPDSKALEARLRRATRPSSAARTRYVDRTPTRARARGLPPQSSRIAMRMSRRRVSTVIARAIVAHAELDSAGMTSRSGDLIETGRGTTAGRLGGRSCSVFRSTSGLSVAPTTRIDHHA